ncbi:hypothetical protein OTU49_017454, partial [Cherax quadricarinatus]
VEPLQLCVDVGCGSGQNTNMYTNYFQQVIGVDVSQEQVQLATKSCTHHNVIFNARDEKFTVETDSTLDDFLGYISSWSAFIKLRDIEGEAAASRFISESKQKLTDVMGIPDERVVLRRRYKYFLRMWRNPAA